MDTYTHLSLYDQRGALDVLPALPDLDGNSSEENEAVALKTGTDDLPVGSYKNHRLWESAVVHTGHCKCEQYANDWV